MNDFNMAYLKSPLGGEWDRVQGNKGGRELKRQWGLRRQVIEAAHGTV